MDARSKTSRMLAAVALFCAGAGSASAVTTTTTFSVTATVGNTCTVSGADLAFGTYAPAAAVALDATTGVDVACTAGTPYSVALSAGTGGGTLAARTLASGGATLAFNLYTTAARNVIWGDGTGTTATVSGTGAGVLTPNAHTVYGRIPVAQDVAPGAYVSVITVTVTY